MAKLTDSDGEYLPADDECKTAPASNTVFSDKLMAFLENDSDRDDFYFSDDSEGIRRKNKQV